MQLENSKELNALIQLLDDPDDNIYREISGKILKIGNTAIPYLESAWENFQLGDAFQCRIEKLIAQIQFDLLEQGLKDWKNNHQNDLLSGVKWIAKYQYPDYDFTKVDTAIDTIVKDIWLEINPSHTALEVTHIINHVLYKTHGFKGDTVNYHAPQNSFINDVLSSKKGNPISLSIMYILICERLHIPVKGINLPHHFIVAFTKEHFPSETVFNNNIFFYINPFSEGSLLQQSDVKEFLKDIGILKDYQNLLMPCTNLDILIRVCHNLVNSYSKLNLPHKKEDINKLLNILLAK